MAILEALKVNSRFRLKHQFLKMKYDIENIQPPLFSLIYTHVLCMFIRGGQSQAQNHLTFVQSIKDKRF